MLLLNPSETADPHFINLSLAERLFFLAYDWLFIADELLTLFVLKMMCLGEYADRL